MVTNGQSHTVLTVDVVYLRVMDVFSGFQTQIRKSEAILEKL